LETAISPIRSSGPLADAWRDLGEVMALSFPVIIAMASHTVMGLVDAWMLSKYGASQLAASGPAGSMSWSVLAFILGTGSCVSTFVSQSLGRGQPAEGSRYTWQGIYLGLVAQVAAIPIILWAPSIFAFFRNPPEVQKLSTVYFRIVLLHVAGTGAYAALSSFFQGIGKPEVPMWAALGANVFNAAAAAVLIFGKFGFPELGMAGAAWATTLASYFQAGLLLIAFLRRPMHERFETRATCGFDLARFKRLLAIGAPSGFTFMLDAASWAVFIQLLISPLGVDMLAANSAAGAILPIAFMPAVGINRAVTVLVGQYIGQGNIRAAKRRAYLSIGVAMAYMVSMGILFVIFRRPIIMFFRTEPSIVRAGGTMLILASIFQAFDALAIVTLGALRGAGDTRFPAVVTVVVGWGIMLPLGYALTFWAGLGYVGAWSAAAVQTALASLILFWRFVGEAWRKIDIFQGVGPEDSGQ
jgi:MATE family multidrug resistance protein